MRHVLFIGCLVLGTAAVSLQAAAFGPPAGKGSYQDLLTLMDEFVQWRDRSANEEGRISADDIGRPIAAVTDYSPTAVTGRLTTLQAFQSRMQAMNVAAWPRSQQVDWLAVRSRLDQQEYRLRLSRPWARDPGFYVDRILTPALSELPVTGADKDRLLKQLRAIPVLLREARATLDDVAADYADFAIHNLSNSDGVGHGQPLRAVPPAGVLGWYDDIIARAEAAQPQLVEDLHRVRTAIRSFDDWLRDQRPDWTAGAGSGKAAFDWYLKHVKLMPWTSDDLVVLGQRELDRLWAIYALERHRNRNLPELQPAPSANDYTGRIAATDARIRQFLDQQAIITVPGDVGELDTNVPWLVRSGGRNFWEEVQYRDPSPDHLHAVIPGHRFDSMMAGRQTHPVRSRIDSAARVEGWATYLEEAMLQAGLFQDLPRTRELIDVFGIFRAARVPADVWLQRGEMNAGEAVNYWLARVPYLDKNVARVDAEIYLRRPPGYGIGYSVGKLQMERLLADRKRQLGEDFDLRTFHDYIMTAGRLPLSLLRWELTGLDDEVRQFWSRAPLPVGR
jgi:hypothetical protein